MWVCMLASRLCKRLPLSLIMTVVCGIVALALALAVMLQASHVEVRSIQALGGSVRTVSRDPSWLVRFVGHVGLLGFNIISVSFRGTDVDDIVIERLNPLSSGIEEIDVSQTMVDDKGFEELGDWPALEVLAAADIHLTDTGLAAFCKRGRAGPLRHLDVSNSKVTMRGIAALAQLPHLSTLVLDGTALGDNAMGGLAALSNLRVLSMNNTAVHIGGLVAVRRLLVLSLDGTPLASGDLSTIEQMRELTVLSIDRTNVGDGAIPFLSEMRQLRKLSIKKTAFSPEGRKRLRVAMPNCNIDD